MTIEKGVNRRGAQTPRVYKECSDAGIGRKERKERKERPEIDGERGRGRIRT